MLKPLQILGCLAILTASFVAVPAHAHGHKAKPMTVPPMADDNSYYAPPVTREALEDERDRVRLKCMDAKGQDRSACETRLQSIRDRMASAPAAATPVEYHDKKGMKHKKGARKTDWKPEHKEYKKKHHGNKAHGGAHSKPGAVQQMEEPPAE